MLKVSVIVPIYKVDPIFFKEAIHSLSAQTLEDAEFILVFDGANQDLENLCASLTKQDPRFVIIKKDHSGVSDTRNYGIKQAKGEYISFVDADDWIPSDIYKTAFEFAQRNNSDIVFWDMATVDQNGTVTQKQYENQSIDNLTPEQRETIMKQFIWVSQSKYGAIISVCCKLVKRSLLLTNNILFSKDIAIGEDRVFFSTLWPKAQNISYLNRNGYFCRENPSSAMHKFHKDGIYRFIKYLDAFDRDFFQKNKAIFGREMYRLILLSCRITYMNSMNPNSYWARMKQMTTDFIEKTIQHYLQNVEEKGLTPKEKIEFRLLRHKIFITLWIRGLLHKI